MSTTATEKKSDFKPVPSGTHVARCFGVIDLGTQISSNPSYKPSHKILVSWELPMETYEVEGKELPMTISKRYTLSINKKATLRKDLDSWRGRGFTDDEAKAFPVQNIIGTPCMLSVTHTPKEGGGMYVNVVSVAGVPRGMPVPPAVHDPIHWQLEQGKDSAFVCLPEWVRKTICKCVEWCPTDTAVVEPAGSQQHEEPEGDDDVPFSFILPWLAPIAAAASLIS